MDTSSCSESSIMMYAVYSQKGFETSGQVFLCNYLRQQTVHFYNDRSLGFVKLNRIVKKGKVRAYFFSISYCISFDHGKRDRDKNRELSGLGTMNNSVPYLHCIRIDD